MAPDAIIQDVWQYTNVRRGSSLCFAECSSLELYVVRCTFHHLQTGKWILKHALWESQIIIALNEMGATSSRPELKNAHSNSKVFFQIHFAVSVWVLETSALTKRSADLSSLSIYKSFWKEQPQERKAAKKASLMYTKTVVWKAIYT